MRCFAWPVALALALAAAFAEEPRMVPFEMPWRPNPRSVLDLSGLLERPAGRGGRVTARGGHLVAPSGRRFRVWGVNLTGGACFPDPSDAPAVAEHLARFGINCVRFHFLDSGWGRGASLFPPDGDTTRRLDPAALARFDRFVFELKKRGIYSNINLNVGRVYRAADGVPDRELIGLGKALQYFDDHIAELHREYATQLLTHRNPHTGTEYRNEPAVLIVELVNENSIVESWFSGRLRGKQAKKHPGTWCDITPHYAAILDRKFNAWLAEHCPADALARWRREAGVGPGQPLPRLRPEQFAKASADRFAAEAAFYMELESRYFLMMKKHLDGLGVGALVVATSDHNHWKTGYPLLASASKLDVVDGHVYWQHPRYTRDAKGRRRGFWIPNTPMVNDPQHSTVVQLARSAVAGKPYTVSETNHPFPSEYACEGIPILAAYALLQDWDGLFFYTFEHAPPSEWDTRRPGHFDICHDPVKMSQLAACAAMFHRGDVAAARATVLRSYSREEVIESIRMSSAERPLFTPGFPRELPLVHALRIESFDRASAVPKFRRHEPLSSDTGELLWFLAGKRGLVTVSTARTQAIVGFAGGQTRAVRGFTADVATPFCSIIVTSLDGQPLEKSGRILVAAGARTATTGMRWRDDRHTLTDWGSRPMRIEPVRGTLTLMRAAGAPRLEAIALDGSGAPLGEPQALAGDGSAAIMQLDKPTVWYLVRAAKR